MPSLREVELKLENADALSEIVDGMRTLAAIYVRRAEATLRAIRPYADNVEAALLEVLDRMFLAGQAVEHGAGALIVIFSSDQGLCGPYNDRVVDAAVEYEGRHPGLNVTLATLGRRGRDLLALRGRETALTLEAPVNVEGVAAAVLETTERLYDIYIEQDIAKLLFAFNRYDSVGRFHPLIQQILPPDRGELHTHAHPRFATEPLMTTDPYTLLGPLAEEFFFIELYRAMLESLASENGARLQAMTFASRNIDDTVRELTQAYRHARQEQITSELLDVVGGAEALRDH